MANGKKYCAENICPQIRGSAITGDTLSWKLWHFTVCWKMLAPGCEKYMGNVCIYYLLALVLRILLLQLEFSYDTWIMNVYISGGNLKCNLLESWYIVHFHMVSVKYYTLRLIEYNGNIPWFSRLIGLKVMENNVTEGHQDNTHTNNVSKDKTVPFGVYFYGKKWGLPYTFRMVRYEFVSIY